MHVVGVTCGSPLVPGVGVAVGGGVHNSVDAMRYLVFCASVLTMTCPNTVSDGVASWEAPLSRYSAAAGAKMEPWKLSLDMWMEVMDGGNTHNT